MSEKSVTYAVEGRVATITLNRPDRLNAFDHAMAEEIWRAVEAAGQDPGVRAVILTGAGRAFCAGGDVKGFAQALETNPGEYVKALAARDHAAVSAIFRLPKPTIAAVNGYASGGGIGLALACDLIVAGEGARFDMAYARIGASPDGGSTYFLPRLIGPRRAMELALCAGALDAAEALRLGLINRVVPDGQVLSAASEWAEKLARGPAFALAKAKELIGQSLHESLETQMEHEAIGIAAAARTTDFAEGVRAFVAKRAPRFGGDA